MILYDTLWYYIVLKATTGYYYRLLQFTTCDTNYYRLFHVTSGYYRGLILNISLWLILVPFLATYAECFLGDYLVIIPSILALTRPQIGFSEKGATWIEWLSSAEYTFCANKTCSEFVMPLCTNMLEVEQILQVIPTLARICLGNADSTAVWQLALVCNPKQPLLLHWV